MEALEPDHDIVDRLHRGSPAAATDAPLRRTMALSHSTRSQVYSGRAALTTSRGSLSTAGFAFRDALARSGGLHTAAEAALAADAGADMAALIRALLDEQVLVPPTRPYAGA